MYTCIIPVSCFIGIYNTLNIKSINVYGQSFHANNILFLQSTSLSEALMMYRSLSVYSWSNLPFVPMKGTASSTEPCITARTFLYPGPRLNINTVPGRNTPVIFKTLRCFPHQYFIRIQWKQTKSSWTPPCAHEAIDGFISRFRLNILRQRNLRC